MVDPPNPRLTTGTPGKSWARVFHLTMLDDPRNRTPPGAGGVLRSAASKASISFWNGGPDGLVVAGRVDGAVAGVGSAARASPAPTNPRTTRTTTRFGVIVNLISF